MAIVVEHDKRKAEILQKALDVFVEEGYEDVTYQKIADRCGITRTTLYIYFKNKREIFLWSIKQLTASMEESLKEIINNAKLTAFDTLWKSISKILDTCQENRKLFNVLLTYLLQLKKGGVNPSERVRRRVIRMRHLLSTILIKGIQNGEFKDQNLHDMNEILFGLIESAIFKITILDEANISDYKSAIKLAITGFLKN